MHELSVQECVRRVIGAADRKRERDTPPVNEERGDVIQRVCLSACQILDARPDGRAVRLRQEPPASDYRKIWTRLNRQWHEQRKI